MKAKNLAILIVILALISFASFVAINGIEMGSIKVGSVREEISLGLDLEGGVFVVLEAVTDLKGDDLKMKMAEAKSIIDQRVNGLGVTQPTIVIEGEKRIRIELPGVKDTQQAIDMIGKTAVLEFIDPENNVVVTGDNVKKADPVYIEGKPVVSLEFDSEGAVKFREATQKLAGKANRQDRIIYIMLDGQPISMPAVGSVISDGKATIEGNFTVEEAAELSTLIRAGALPVEMQEIQSSEIGPTLGLESLDKSVFAAGIGILLIFAFMILYYRIPGIVASIALVLFMLFVVGTMIVMNATLTLPGVAGLILSIGMAVDANVVIFERIKEELRVGKSVRVAIESGFKRAIRTVMDANITTLIAGGVLFYFGTGPIKGFAVTLIIGLIASLVTAVFVTKYLLRLFVGLNITKSKKAFGA